MTKTKGDPVETRHRLRLAALAVLDEKGYDEARASEIARRAGLTTGAIYANYSSKNELIADALAAAAADPRPLLRDLGFEIPADGDVLPAALERLVLGEGLFQPELILSVAARAIHDDAVQQRLLAGIAASSEVMGELIKEAQLDGSLDGELPTEAVVYFTQLISLGLVMARAIQMVGPPDGDVRHVLQRITDGLAAPAPNTGTESRTNEQEEKS